MADVLYVTKHEHGPVNLLRLEGHLSGHTAPELSEVTNELIDAGRVRLIYDLSGLEYIASAGIGVFINTQQRVRQQDGCVQLVSPPPVVREVFNIIGIEALLSIHEDLESAVAAALGDGQQG